MAFKVGDRVRFLDSVGEGVIRSVLSDNQVMVEDETGFEYPYPAKQLLLIKNAGKEHEAYRIAEQEVRETIMRNVHPDTIKKAEQDFNLKYKNPTATNVYRKGEYIEVDLHIHELVDNTSGLENADIIQIQMRHFERMMGIAEQKKVKRVILIHGVGQGVLRAEIRRNLMQYYPNARYHDADFRVYGQGATEVVLYGG